MGKRKVNVKLGNNDLRKKLPSRSVPKISRIVSFHGTSRDTLDDLIAHDRLVEKCSQHTPRRTISISRDPVPNVLTRNGLRDPSSETFEQSLSTPTSHGHHNYFSRKVGSAATGSTACVSTNLVNGSSADSSANYCDVSSHGRKRLSLEVEKNLAGITPPSKRHRSDKDPYSIRQSNNSPTVHPVQHSHGKYSSYLSEHGRKPSSASNFPTSSGQERPHEEPTPQPMSYTGVKKLCEENSPEETAARLTEENTLRRFEALLATGTDIRYDLMKLVVSVIEIVCRSRTESLSNRLFGIIQKTNYWESLSKFIGELFSTQMVLTDRHLPLFITNLCKIFSLCLDRLPHLHSSIPIPQLKDAVELFKGEGKIQDSTIDCLLEDINLKRQRILKEKRDKASSQLQPPDDFRSLSIFPTREDIFKKGKPFLRKNLVDKPFSNIDHYLDVQFRLLKEDSLADLRNGIHNLRRQDRQNEFRGSCIKPGNGHKNDIKVYHSVEINDVVTSKNRVNGIVHNVSFDPQHPSIKYTNWKRSKRLLFGSLVCLLSEDFQTIYFATVQNRSPDMLKEGYVQLCFEGDEIPSPAGYDGTPGSFRMVESSSAYFMAYRHILKQLQEITETTMPFKDYIIACKREIRQPAYLQPKKNDKNPQTIDFTSIAADQCELVNMDVENSHKSLKNVDPSDLSTWPDANVLGLNDSQYSAFQSAIRREFVVIQGPPGTGKTYLGLKIAHALLANSHIWKGDEDESSPILMLAYTNHALDQFLEGLAISKQDIIRVGGRSSSETLQDCNLNVVRREWTKEAERFPFGISKRIRQVDAKLKDCEAKLHRSRNVYIQSFKGILPAREFKGSMKQIHCLEIIHDEDMLKFLFIHRNPAAKFKDTVASEHGDAFDEVGLRDNEGYFSAGRFIRSEDDDESGSKYNKIVTCLIEETKNPNEIRRHLTQIQDVEDPNVRRLEDEASRPDELRRLTKRQRWFLYRLWLARLRNELNRNIRNLQQQHLELNGERDELRNIEDLSILTKARVVGMTTTCAAKSHKLLRQLRPRIVIIEEAAEVFEGHVVSSLTEYCQHLILIGDHQQLRPNPSVYKLSVDYSLDVSLLERMIRAGVPYNRLAVQHRMRPDISQIIRHIYNDLEDHVSVGRYENVKGISKNLYFVDHCVAEGVRENVHSKTNAHEAGFLVAFCHYLLRQGYDTSQITILTTYTGQMFEIRDLMKCQDGTHSPRVTSVDNFQGEENDIILLSLVRNNADGNIGFLKTDNRICVALSRARQGLYIMGSRKMLSTQSDLWKSVLDDFQKNDCIGEYLPLVCSKHGTISQVSNEKDFDEMVPNGGCLKPCSHRLDCGHTCPEVCHPDGHDLFQCKKPCERNVIGCGIPDHKCTKLCYELCDNVCKYPVQKTLKCGHTRELACSDNENTVRCQKQCEKTLPCGHRCQSHCGMLCTKMCLELVKKTDWPCGHENTVACSATPKDCGIPCNVVLECEHTCAGKCGSCIQGRVHVKCKKRCERSLICSHLCKSVCTKNCPPCREECIRKCDHSKCSRSCGEICIPCKERCRWECEHFKCNKLCSEMCDRPRCNEPCKRELSCGKKGSPHYCRGLCGERCVCVFCHKNNGHEDITEIMFGTEDEEDARFIRLKDCEHIFEYTALDTLMDYNESGDEIKPKLCPLCKRPVEKSWRYGNLVKAIHQDIDNIKKIILGNTADLDDRKQLVRKLIEDVTPMVKKHGKGQSSSLAAIEKSVNEVSKIRYQDILLIESQVQLLKKWFLLWKNYTDALQGCTERRKSDNHCEFRIEMENILQRIMDRPSNLDSRILQDLNLELERMSLKRDVLVLLTKLASTGACLKESGKELIEKVEKSLKNTAIIKEEIIEKFKQQITEIYSQYPQLSAVTQEEKVQIVKAIGLKQGHWFKCPNGHYYAIGECGGAMEKSRCADCGAVIGGQHHRLENDNSLAPEMDGARHAAWSEQANLGNYHIE